MTQAETKRVAEKKKKQKKYNSTTGQCSFVSSFKSKIVDRLESEMLTIFGDLKYLLGLASIVSRKKKSIYVYLL